MSPLPFYPKNKPRIADPGLLQLTHQNMNAHILHNSEIKDEYFFESDK